MQTPAQGDYGPVAVWFPRGIIVTPELLSGIPALKCHKRLSRNHLCLSLTHCLCHQDNNRHY